MNKAVARAIASERAIAGMTIDELVKTSGIPKSSLMRILNAERDVKVNQIQKLATALQIFPHELMETAENILDRESRKLKAVADKARNVDVDVNIEGDHNTVKEIGVS